MPPLGKATTCPARDTIATVPILTESLRMGNLHEVQNPPDPNIAGIPDTARCLGCDYLLRELPGRRCPECGRDFDPARPETMNLGRRLGWLGKRMLRPMGWPMLIGVWVVVGVLVWVSGWVLPTVRPSLIDVRWYQHDHGAWKLAGLEVHEKAYVLALYGMMLLGGLWAMRLGGRAVTRWRHRGKGYRVFGDWRRQGMLVVGLVVCGYLVAYGWPRRVANQWAAFSVRVPLIPAGIGAIQVPPEEHWGVLIVAVEELPQRRQRIAGLKFLVEETRLAHEILPDAVRRERDPEVLVAEIQLLGLLDHGGQEDFLAGLLQARNATVRAAAADALAMLHRSLIGAFNEPILLNGILLRSNPQINLSTGLTTFPGLAAWSVPNAPVPFTPLLKAALERQMLQGETLAEREAAARALVPFPPAASHLRVAEWGVWLSNGGEGGDLKLATPAIAEIPPFVHRTSDAMKSFQDRLNPIIFIDKPVIHMTSDMPMAVDLEVQIAWGRPWFAYPRPDDYAETAALTSGPWAAPVPSTQPSVPAIQAIQGLQPFLQILDPVPSVESEDLREGNPAFSPRHREKGSMSGWTGINVRNDFIAVGVRWQSLIVSPTRLPWMQFAPLGKDPKFAWWSRLREVPTSYISSRGESERFLYYDGPTLMKAPLVVGRSADAISFSAPPAGPPESVLAGQSFQLLGQNGQWAGERAVGVKPGKRVGMFVRVGGAGAGNRLKAELRAQAQVIDDVRAGVSVPVQPDLLGDDVPATFKRMIIAAGLTEAEASGMVDCWKEQFFNTPGERFLLIMSREDYDAYCPMFVRPTPTEMARVGVVLTEWPAR